MTTSDAEIDAALDQVIERMRVGWETRQAEDVATAIDVLANLGQRVTAKRAERGLSYRLAAAQIDIAPSSMWGIEHGRRDPGLIVVLRVLRWLSDDGATWD